MAKIDVSIIEKVKALKIELSKSIPVSRAILYGSYAKGNQHQGSDIDICLVLPDEIDPTTVLRETSYAIIRTDCRFEPVFYTEKDMADSPSFGLLREIKETGVEIGN